MKIVHLYDWSFNILLFPTFEASGKKTSQAHQSLIQDFLLKAECVRETAYVRVGDAMKIDLYGLLV